MLTSDDEALRLLEVYERALKRVCGEDVKVDPDRVSYLQLVTPFDEEHAEEIGYYGKR